MKDKKMKMRVWHIPQIPMKPFHVSVDTAKEIEVQVITN